MIDIRYPNITAANEAAQLLQVKSYLHQLVDQLNIALRDVENTATASTVPAVKSAAELKTENDTNAHSTFNSIKALIIKSADIVNAYYDEINRRLEGVYVAESDFGSYAEKTALEVIETSSKITEMYDNVQALFTDMYGPEGSGGGIKDQILETDAYIKRGELDRDDDGFPIIGIEIGQTNEENGQKVFEQYARFTAKKLSFYDQNKNEVAYVSDDTLHITNVEIVAEEGNATYRIGGFEDEAKNDGSVITRWVGV